MTSFIPEHTTVWSFPERGSWATHNPRYRGNWAPQIPRNLITKYTDEGDLVLDPMVGGGTTLIEARILNRDAVGVDINQMAVDITNENLRFDVDNQSKQTCFLGDARDLSTIADNSIDLIATHPPYLNIIRYSNGPIEGDLSALEDLQSFMAAMGKATKEFYRVLKPDHYCAILIGDTRRKCHYVPIAYHVMAVCLNNGFILKENIIKVQHNCRSTRTWNAMLRRHGFYLIAHEHLFIFRKPKSNEPKETYKDSSLAG